MYIDMSKTFWQVLTKDIFILALLYRTIHTIYTYSYLYLATCNHQTLSQVPYKTLGMTIVIGIMQWSNCTNRSAKEKANGEETSQKKERGYFLLSLGFNALPTYANQELRAVSASPRGRQRQRQVQTGLLAFYDNNNNAVATTTAT